MKISIYGHYHCKKCSAVMKPKFRLGWAVEYGVRCVHQCLNCNLVFIEQEHGRGKWIK